MFGITDLSTYLIGVVAVILLPGPNSMYCLAVAGQHGVAAGYRVIAGILLGDAILMAATALGAGSVLRLHPGLFAGIRLVGGLYLLWLGINLLRAAWQRWQQRHAQPAGRATPVLRSRHACRRSLLLSLTNPKAILFFLSFFVQFVDPAYPYPALSFLALACLLQLVSFAYLSLLVFAGQRLVQGFRGRHRLAAAGLTLVGLMFMGFALRMWFSPA